MAALAGPRGPGGLRDTALFLALVMLVAESAGQLACRLLPAATPLDRLVAGGTLFLAQTTVVQNALGLIGQLRLPSILLAHLLVGAFTRGRPKRGGAGGPDRPATVPLHGRARPAVAHVPSTLGPALRGLVRAGPFVLAMVIFTVLIMGVAFVNSLRYVPHEDDSLRAHLPIAVEMLKTGRVAVSSAVPRAFLAYATSWETWLNWLMVPFRNDYLVHLAQWAFLLPALGALYGVCRRLGAGPRAAALAPLVFATTPVVWEQVQQCKNDVAVAAIFISAVHFILLTRHGGGWGALVLAAVATGLVAGLKGSGPAYAAALSVTALVVLLVRAPRLPLRGATGCFQPVPAPSPVQGEGRVRVAASCAQTTPPLTPPVPARVSPTGRGGLQATRGTPVLSPDSRWLTARRFAPAVIVWVAVAMLLGGWWYVWKYAVSGSVMGWGGGLPTDRMHILYYAVREGGRIPVFGGPGDYFRWLGHVAPAAAAVAVPLALVWCLRGRGERLARFVLLPFLGAAAFAVFAVTPASARVAWNARYGLPVWALLIVAVAVVSALWKSGDSMLGKPSPLRPLPRGAGWGEGGAKRPMQSPDFPVALVMAAAVIDAGYILRASLVRTVLMAAVSLGLGVGVSLVCRPAHLDRWAAWWKRRRRSFVILVEGLVAALLLAVAFLGIRAVARHADAVRYGPTAYGFAKGGVEVGESWTRLNALTGGDLVAWAGDSRIYPLYGQGLKNDVVRVSRTERPENDPWVLPLPKADPEPWLKNLTASGAGWLWCGGLWKEDPLTDLEPPQEQVWAEARPDLFEEVFRNRRAAIFRIRGARP